MFARVRLAIYMRVSVCVCVFVCACVLDCVFGNSENVQTVCIMYVS